MYCSIPVHNQPDNNTSLSDNPCLYLPDNPAQETYDRK